MGRKTFSSPVFIVGTAGTDDVLEVSATSGDDSNIGTRTGVIQASGDLKSQSVGGMKVGVGPFIKQNFTTNAAETVMDIVGLASVQDEVAMPYAGSILGITTSLDANITAGTLTVYATKNGTTVVVSSNAATTVRLISATQNKDVDTFVAGDRIGVKWKSTASLAPTTLDGTTTVWVEI